MSSNSFNYNKWDNIELSDDESDCHPNIDKESWFRLKHRTRIEREEKEDREILKFEKLNDEDDSKLSILNGKMSRIQNGDDSENLEDIESLRFQISEIKMAMEKRNKYIYDVKEKRKWNIDNICQVKEEKTILSSHVPTSLKAEDFKVPSTENRYQETDNTVATRVDINTPLPKNESSIEHNTEDSNPNHYSNTKQKNPEFHVYDNPKPAEFIREKFAAISYNDFAISYEDILENFSEIKDMEETKDFLFKNCNILLHEHAQSYMLLSCLEDEMNGKHDRMKLVCRQSQILSHIQELGVSMHRDPRDVILPFFTRIEESQYFMAFMKAIDDFTVKIKHRAIEKKKEMDEERKTVSSGKLDPYEVFESLPPTLQKAFESESIDELKRVISEMPADEAKYHMKRCVESGLWIPANPNEFD